MIILNTVIIVILGLACLVQFGFRSFWAGIAPSWDRNSTFVFSLATLLNLPNVAAAYLGGQNIVLDAFGDGHITYSPDVQRLQMISGIAVLLVALWLIFKTIDLGQSPNRYVWPLLAILLISFLSNLESGLEFATFNQLTATAVVSACLFARPSRGAATGAALFGIFYALLFCGLVVASPLTAIAECSARKCSPTGVLLPGLNGSENAFGLCIVLALPFVILALRGKRRYIFALLLAYITVASGSRSALLGLGSVAFLLMTSMALRPVPARRVFLLFGSTVAVVGFSLPIVVDDPEAFSTRGRVWQIGWTYIEQSPIWGAGSSVWGDLVSQGVISRSDAYSVHNLWIDTLFVSGWTGVFLLLWFFILLVIDNRSTQAQMALLFILVPVVAIGALERSISIYSSNWIGWVLPAILLFRVSDRLLPAPTDRLLTAHAENIR